MTRYCLEAGSGDAIIHKLDCNAYDLGTLLGLGCLADLGEFAQLGLALEHVAQQHPGAVPCPECCGQELRLLPQPWRPVGLPAISLPST